MYIHYFTMYIHVYTFQEFKYVSICFQKCIYMSERVYDVYVLQHSTYTSYTWFRHGASTEAAAASSLHGSLWASAWSSLGATAGCLNPLGVLIIGGLDGLQLGLELLEGVRLHFGVCICHMALVLSATVLMLSPEGIKIELMMRAFLCDYIFLSSNY